ncbi:cytochrome P450 [Amycolatopsis sp. NPDC059027]|uniref:cytochrome P450 n=1 Tax=unclassified Amycolatopsis TaxID=2618356 RepID=UPI00367136EA
MVTDPLPPFGFTGWTGERLANPYPAYRRYRDHDPVHHSDAWYVFRYDDVVSVLSSRDFGRRSVDGAPIVPERHETLRAIVENWLVFLDPPRHGRLRTLLAREFSLDVVQDLRGRIRELTWDLLLSIRDKPVVELIGDFAAPLPILVVSELLGVPEDHRTWFRACALELEEATSARARRLPDGYVRADDAAQRLAEYFARAARSRRGGEQRDLITLLATNPELTETEVVATCVHLLTAGHETTTNLIGKSVLALLAHPDLLRWLRAHPEFLPDMVDELIRYDCPVQFVTRWAYRDVVLRGRDIRRGDKVLLALGSANRDPLRFPDPDLLRLNRTGGRHTGFGFGIHYCLGAALARTEAEIGLAALLAGLPGFELTGEPVPYADDLVFHGPRRLTLEIR